jgi:hypothetical protein
MKTCNICKNKFEVVSEMDANNNICGSCREPLLNDFFTELARIEQQPPVPDPEPDLDESTEQTKSEEPKKPVARMNWIYLTKHPSEMGCGMRTWYRDFRADIKLKDGMYEYWLSECFNSERDVYWTKSRYEPDVFEAMRKAEIWLKQYANTYWDELYEEDEPEMF